MRCKMASKAQNVQRLITFINQQFEILKEQKKSILENVDESINKVQNEVDAWVNGGLVNQTTCAEMNNRIQQVIALFMTKSFELSDLESQENSTTSATSNDSIIPKTSYTKDETKATTMISRDDTVNKSGVDTYITTTRFAILEEAVYSLKKTTEQIQEKHENINKKMEILTNANLKSKKKFQEKLGELEKTSKENQGRHAAIERTSKEISFNVDNLSETVANVHVTLNRLEDENQYVNVSMNKLNEQISSVRTCSNDALMSIQDLSKSVESTNQNYDEMSDKMNQLEISINLMSTQYTEHFENMSTINKEKVDETIGLACHMLAKRLAPLDKLNEILNKKAESKTRLSQEDAAENQVAQLNEKISQLELKCSFPNVGFYASTTMFVINDLWTDVTKFDYVKANYGNHFDPVTGKFTAPLNGLYLISMSASYDGINETYTKCILRRNNSLIPAENKIMVLGGTGNQSVTRCSEMSAGHVIYLQSGNVDENIKINIKLHFSCFMIKR